ncbi:MAG: rod shape-determining protein [Clostridia bacterium]|nr:rod shape-determining protein [Clostridia bacterium]
MAVIDLGIDFGSSNTTIYQQGFGIVLKEPSVIALRKERKLEVVAVGSKAKRLVGKVSANTQVVYPIRDGVITNNDAAILLLKKLIARLLPEGSFKPRIRALVSIPCGLSLAERKAYETVMQKAGVNEVTFIDTPIAISRLLSHGGVVVSIGGGVTDVALVANNEIIDGASINIAGDAINNAITDYLYEKQNVKIGQATTEKIKLAIASLYANDTSSIEVIGRDADSGAQRTFIITAKEVCDLIEPLLKKITDIISSMITYAPTEVAETMTENGIYLCGGTALLPGLCEYMANLVRMKVTLLDDAQSTVINALGTLVGERDKLAEFLKLTKI